VSVPRTAFTLALLPVLISCSTAHRSGDKPAPIAQSPRTANGDVKPQKFNASGLLAGSANPNLPAGDPGKVSVVQVGPLTKDPIGSATLPFAFRNNTAEDISHVDWTGTARSAGAIVTTGSSQGAIPAQIRPGEIGLACIYFQLNSKLPPDDAQYEFTVNTSPANQSSYNTAPLKVTEVNPSGDSIVGAAVNNTGARVAGPFAVSAYCFDADALLAQHGSFAQQTGPLTAGGQATFTDALYGAKCPSFVVGVSGFFDE
jgi:hypothetical protein